MHLSLIVAVADNGVIGDSEGREPWDLPADLQHFREATMGHPVIMGRRTYEKIGHPLTGRQTIVLTSKQDFTAPGCEVARNLDEALALAPDAEEVFVMGGGEIYAAALPRVQTMYVTHVHSAPDGNVFFRFDPAEWAETERQDFVAAADQPAYSFVTYERRP